MNNTKLEKIIDKLTPVILNKDTEYKDASDYKRCHMIAYAVAKYLETVWIIKDK